MKSLFSRLRNDAPRPAQPSQHADPPPAPPAAPAPARPTSSRKPAPPRPALTPPSRQTSASTSTSASAEYQDAPHSADAAGFGHATRRADGDEAEWAVRQRTMSEAGRKVKFQSPAPSALLGDRGRQPSRASTASSPTKPRVPLPSRPPSAVSQRPGSRSSFFRRPSSTNPSSPTKMMSPTPSDMSQHTAGSEMSYLPPPGSWSETIDEDLIMNLGPRERTRQEVLWEIVSSEERYVAELVKLNDTFCRPLLPNTQMSPSLSFDATSTLTRTFSPASVLAPSALDADTASIDHLPIAARYASASSRLSMDGSVRSPDSSLRSPDSIRSPNPSIGSPAEEPHSARLTAYHILTNGRPSQPPSRKPSATTLPRSHMSMPPRGPNASSRASLQTKDRRASTIPTRPALPPDLREALSAIGGMLEGHSKLVAALRKRYDNQYPLVRSLADVFTSHSYILRDYATYVLHLENALEQLNEALDSVKGVGKRTSRRVDNALGRYLWHLEELAAERGESGLAISLSKPFQRLLKYPLLFQNLLFNTDASTREYEATLAMVDEVEMIVRSIEDEKTSNEERERTRDVWARMDGVEDKVLMAPKPGRLLVSETQQQPAAADAAKQKKSHRLSDLMRHKPMELWVVKFTDVSLLCQRTGSTTLPMSTLQGNRSDSTSDMSRAKNNRRATSLKPRNLYRFVRVHQWQLKSSPSGPVVDKAVIGQNQVSEKAAELTTPRKASAHAATGDHDDTPRGTPTKVPLKSIDGPTPRRRLDDAVSLASTDHLSVMSFAFKGAEVRPRTKITSPTRPTAARPSAAANVAAAARRNSGGHMTSTANAKFAHRLRSTEPSAGDATIRPDSSGRRSLPPAMIARPPALGHGDKTVNARPAWNASTRPAAPRDKATAAPGSGARAPSVMSTRKMVRPTAADGRSRVGGLAVERVPGARDMRTGRPGQAAAAPAGHRRTASDDGSALASSALGSSAGMWRAYEGKVERGGHI